MRQPDISIGDEHGDHTDDPCPDEVGADHDGQPRQRVDERTPDDE